MSGKYGRGLVAREEYWQNRQKAERKKKEKRKVVSRSRQGFGDITNSVSNVEILCLLTIGSGRYKALQIE